jgi:hypothetical protein
MINKKVTTNNKTKKVDKLTPKQKAMDKNKNGKIDGGDFSMLRKKKK